MTQRLSRRELLKLSGVGGVVYASGLWSGCASSARMLPAPEHGGPTATPNPSPRAANEDFFFLQISDTHWGFSGAVNPHADVELPNAVAAINAVSAKPDFVIFTGDLTHTTPDGEERSKRMSQFKQIASGLNVASIKYMPGEHDAALDAGAMYAEFFGELHYAFDHKGVHFIALDNVSDQQAKLGDAQLMWLKNDLSKLDADAPIVVFSHRPLWDLKPEWEWTTADGQLALELLMPFRNVSAFFGHVHQELHHATGHIMHHAARSLIFPLPPPQTEGKRAPLPWDPEHPDRELGYLKIEAKSQPVSYELTEILLAAQAARP